MPKTKEQRSNYNLDEEKIINIDTEEKDLDEVITDEEEDTDEVEEAILPTVPNEVLKLSVEELDLPVRITNALKAINIDTVDQLINTPKVQLLKAKNLGVQSLNLISQKIEERGLSLREA